MTFPPCEVACLAPLPMFQFHLLIARPLHMAQGGRATRTNWLCRPEKATVAVVQIRAAWWELWVGHPRLLQ